MVSKERVNQVQASPESARVCRAQLRWSAKDSTRLAAKVCGRGGRLTCTIASVMDTDCSAAFLAGAVTRDGHLGARERGQRRGNPMAHFHM